MSLPNLLEPVGFHLWMDGVYEPFVMKFIMQHCTAGSTFLDVGANIGAFTIPVAQWVGETGTVLAVEPSPGVVPYLRENVNLNALHNVIIEECAASTGEWATIPFYQPPADHFGMGSSAPQFNVAPISVPAKSVDTIVSAAGLTNVALMKVDVEGYEAHVFLGANELLRSTSPPVVVFEFCDWAEERAFPGRKGWAQRILRDYGYSIWTLTDYLRSRECLSAPITAGFESIVAVPPCQYKAVPPRTRS